MTLSLQVPVEHGNTAATPLRDPLPIRLAFFSFWALIFTIPWENLIVIPGLGTVAHLVGYVTIAIGLLAIIDRGRLRNPTASLLLIAAFAFCRCISILWTAAPDPTLIDVQTTLQMLAMVWLLHQLAFSQKRMFSILQAYVLGAAVSAEQTIQQYLTGRFPVQQSRFWAKGFDPNELALMLVLSIPISLYLSCRVQKRSIAWLYRLQAMLAGFAILLTAARGPFLALAGVLMFLPAVFLRSGERQKVVLLGIGALTVCLLIFFVPSTAWSRLGTIGGEISSGTLNDRRLIWEAGLDEFGRHPVIGVGAGAFSTAVRNSTGISYVAHNTFLSILVEEGLLGFALFLAVYLNSIRLCLHMPRFERSFWLSMLMSFSIGVFSLTWEFRKPFWLIFGLISVHACVTRRQNQSVRPAVPAPIGFRPAFPMPVVEKRS